MTLPEECLTEMKMRDWERITVNLLSSNESSTIISSQDYHNLRRLLRLKAYVFKFVELLKRAKAPNMQQSRQAENTLTAEDIDPALMSWLKRSQPELIKMEGFHLWSWRFGLFKESNGLWRCNGRLSNAGVSEDVKHPVFLYKNHPLTSLIVQECHTIVIHSGAKSTLTELRSTYRAASGRQLVRKILYKCVTCHQFQGRP